MKLEIVVRKQFVDWRVVEKKHPGTRRIPYRMNAGLNEKKAFKRGTVK